jgi:D-alanyl-D-alanine carboxypeptidase
MVKVGGISLMNNVDENKSIKTTLVTKDKTSTTKNTTSTTKSTTTTTTSTTTTKKSDITTSNTQGLKIIDGILIVNKTYPLPEDYVPTNTYKSADGLNYCTTCIDIDAYEQYKLMKADATSLGLNIWIQSGYRSYNLQNNLYNKYVNRDGKVAADTYSARPGHSEHQTGLAFDLNTITDDFQYTNEGIWINENCYKYGFILRYPKGKENITGYKYESWHLRYVGIDLANKLYNNGDWITLEEHFNLTSQYSD